MKRFFAILSVLAACLALFCVTAGAEDIPNDVTWEEISSESQLRAGVWYTLCQGHAEL